MYDFTWVIEESNFDSENVQDLIKVLDSSNIQYQTIKYRPFESRPQLNKRLPDQPFIPYGTINFVQKAQENPNFVGFCNFNLFRYNKYLPFLKNNSKKEDEI